MERIDYTELPDGRVEVRRKHKEGAGYLPADPQRTPTPHYMRGGIECIDAMRAISTPAEFQAFCRLTAFKYLWRLGEKDNPAREAKKALDYVRWLKESLDSEADGAPARGGKK